MTLPRAQTQPSFDHRPIKDHNLASLSQKIKNRRARIAVIGLGYVGLPLACELARLGFRVTGIEHKTARVEEINHMRRGGRSPIGGDEPGLADLLVGMVESGRLSASSDFAQMRDCDIVLVNVETPIDETHTPRYESLQKAIINVGAALRPGGLVIIESTVSPGTTQNLVSHWLNLASGQILNHGYFLGHCPERVMPGRLLANLRTQPRVIGGMTPATAEVMAELYRCLTDGDLDLTDCLTAELVKTIENAYRDVQIAFANEAALICEALNGDVWEVRRLVNKTSQRQMHLPGAGVGGHCIPKDPWLLVHSVDNGLTKLIPAARQINADMPAHMVKLTAEALNQADRSLGGSRLLVMGYAYLEDSDDFRNSPSVSLVGLLNELGAETVIHDPYILDFQGDLIEKARACDALIVMVRHAAYLNLDLQPVKNVMRTAILIDGRDIFDHPKLRRAGWTTRLIGQGLQ